MAATVLAVVPLNRAVQYDGTNSADILAAIPGSSLVSETGQMLTILSNGAERFAPVGGYFLFDQFGNCYDGITGESFDAGFKVVPEV